MSISPSLDKLIVWSLSVKSGDAAAIRERLTLNEEARHEILDSILKIARDTSPEASLLYLETCHRVEVYAFAIDASLIHERWLESRDYEASRDKLKTGLSAFSHLCRVSSSMESEVLGETQITGQVRDAANLARENKWLSGPLDKCVQQALRIAKKIRSQTSLGKGTISIAHVAVDGLSDVFEDFSNKKALVIGSGPMALQSIERLELKNLAGITWVNRNYENIAKHPHASRLNLASYEDRHKLAWTHDIIISATSSPTFILDLESLNEASKNVETKSESPAVILDLGLPRNVDERLHGYSRFYVRNVDEFNDRASENLEKRGLAIRLATEVLDKELDEFISSWNVWEKAPLLADLFSSIDALRKELTAHLPLEEKNEIEYIVRSVYAKLMHRLVEELDSLDEPLSTQVLSTVVRAWRQPSEWQQKNLPQEQKAQRRK